MGTEKNKSIRVWIIGLLAAALLMFGLYTVFKPKAVSGSKNVSVEVVNDQGESLSFGKTTDAEYLRQFMDELSETTDFSYAGSDEGGMFYVTTVNGLTADFNKDGAYWAVYVNGEYGMYSVDEQPVADGDVFRFAYEK